MSDPKQMNVEPRIVMILVVDGILPSLLSCQGNTGKETRIKSSLLLTWPVTVSPTLSNTSWRTCFKLLVTTLVTVRYHCCRLLLFEPSYNPHESEWISETGKQIPRCAQTCLFECGTTSSLQVSNVKVKHAFQKYWPPVATITNVLSLYQNVLKTTWIENTQLVTTAYYCIFLHTSDMLSC